MPHCLSVCLCPRAYTQSDSPVGSTNVASVGLCIRALRCRYVCRILRRACLSVCLSTSTSPQLHGQYWRGSVSSGGIAIWFMDDIMFFAHNGSEQATQKRCICSKRLNRRQHGYHTAACTQTGPPGATPNRGRNLTSRIALF